MNASPDQVEVQQRLGRYLEQEGGRLIATARWIWENPELGYEESEASARLAALLRDDGFAVEAPLAQLSTAFRAVYRGQTGPDYPRFALLAEYDALAGIGHACGHNLIGTATVAAALALRHAWPEIPAEVQVIGTPAEETEGAKVLLADRDVFTGLSAALMFHPGAGRANTYKAALACRSLRIQFHGRPAHAAGAPWQGVNALDAMIQFFVNAGLLRQQLQDDTRLHGIITHGGEASNVIPAFTEADYLVRADTVGRLNEVYRRVKACAEGAGLATGCRVEFVEGVTYADVLENRALSEVFQRHAEPLGYVFDPPRHQPGGSTDFGNVSRRCPALHAYLNIAPGGVGGHTVAFREAANSDQGYKVMLDAAYAMAATVAELAGDVSLQARVWADYQQQSRN
ncbi:MAG: M20 family metallopeptidase [Thermaerobacterales bacterium]